jgi:hypothetical protein
VVAVTVVLMGYGDYREILELQAAIEARGREAVVWDTTEWPSESPVSVRVGADEATVGERLPLDEVTGALAYLNYVFDPIEARFEELYETESVPAALGRLAQWELTFKSLLPVLEARGADVIAPPGVEYWHDVKPAQLTRFDRAGVPVPPTLFTNDPDRVRAFVAEHGTVVAKPVTMGAAPERLTGADLTDDRLERLAAAPVQFQAYAPGDDVRVYVLENQVIGASRIETDAWTYDRVSPDEGEGEEGPAVAVEAVELRPAVREAVETAAAASPVRFGAVDVRLTPETFAVLELNPHPRFAFHDIEGDTDVTGRLADHLC